MSSGREKMDSRLRSLSEARIWTREVYQKLKRCLKREWAYIGDICRTGSRLEKKEMLLKLNFFIVLYAIQCNIQNHLEISILVITAV